MPCRKLVNEFKNTRIIGGAIQENRKVETYKSALFQLEAIRITNIDCNSASGSEVVLVANPVAGVSALRGNREKVRSGHLLTIIAIKRHLHPEMAAS